MDDINNLSGLGSGEKKNMMSDSTETKDTDENENSIEELREQSVSDADKTISKVEVYSSDADEQRIDSDNSAKKKKFIIRVSSIAAAIIISIVAFNIALLLIFLIVNYHRPTVNLDKYVHIETEGVNGYGIARASFDMDKFIRDNEKKFKFTKKMKKTIQEENSAYWGLMLYNVNVNDNKDAVKLFYYTCIANGSLSKSAKLSNGDVITYSWSDGSPYFNEDEIQKIAKEMGVKVKYSDFDYEVSNLEDVPNFDAFEGVEISYSGIAPNGKALVASYPDNGLVYEIKDNTGLSNGDEVIVLAETPYGIDKYVSTNKRIPIETEKVFKVEGLGEYYTSASQIPDDVLEQMKNQATDVIKGSTYGWKQGYTLDIDYIGNYFLIAKDKTEETQNMLILVYKMHWENTIEDFTGETKTLDCDYYYYVNWDNIYKKVDGTCEYDKNEYWKTKDTVTYSWDVYTDGENGKPYSWTQVSYYFSGYEKLDSIYDIYVTGHIEKYKFEDNILETYK